MLTSTCNMLVRKALVVELPAVGCCRQKWGPHCWEPECSPFKPGAGHARFAHCHESPHVLPVHSPSLVSKSSPCYFTALVLVNAVFRAGPPNKTGHSAHKCKWFKPIPRVSTYRIQNTKRYQNVLLSIDRWIYVLFFKMLYPWIRQTVVWRILNGWFIPRWPCAVDRMFKSKSCPWPRVRL